MKRLLGILVVGFSLAASPVAAWTFMNGNQLFENCTAIQLDEIGVCYGYIEGVADSISGVQATGGSYRGVKICTPTTITSQQAVDVTLNWLKSNPRHRHYAASDLVAQALAKAWPCPK